MKNMDLTPENVRLLWNKMCAHYGTRVVRKQDAWIMRAAGHVLPTPGFMDQYVTTLWGTIYVPFEVGDESSGWSLLGQAAVCAHEHQHVVQERRDGSWRYSWRYVTSTAWRAAYETEGYRATLEMRYGLGVPVDVLLFDATRYAAGLRNYGCTESQVWIASQTLQTAVVEMSRDQMFSTEAARVALDYLLTKG